MADAPPSRHPVHGAAAGLAVHAPAGGDGTGVEAYSEYSTPCPRVAPLGLAALVLLLFSLSLLCLCLCCSPALSGLSPVETGDGDGGAGRTFRRYGLGLAGLARVSSRASSARAACAACRRSVQDRVCARASKVMAYYAPMMRTVTYLAPIISHPLAVALMWCALGIGWLWWALGMGWR